VCVCVCVCVCGVCVLCSMRLALVGVLIKWLYEMHGATMKIISWNLFLSVTILYTETAE